MTLQPSAPSTQPLGGLPVTTPGTLTSGRVWTGPPWNWEPSCPPSSCSPRRPPLEVRFRDSPTPYIVSSRFTRTPTGGKASARMQALHISGRRLTRAATPSTAAPVGWRLRCYTDDGADRGPACSHLKATHCTPPHARSRPCGPAPCAATVHRRRDRPWPCILYPQLNAARLPLPAAAPVVRRLGCYVDDVEDRGPSLHASNCVTLAHRFCPPPQPPPWSGAWAATWTTWWSAPCRCAWPPPTGA